MRKRQITAGILIAASVASSLAATARASSKETIDRAVGVYLSRQGQRYFRNHLEDLLYRNGLALSDGQFKKFEYRAEEPIDLDRLPPKMQKFQGSLDNVRSILRNWLMGFRLNDPRFDGQLKGIHYRARFNRLGLRADPEASKAAGLEDAVVLNLEIEIPELRVEVATVRASDLNNSFLGTFGANHLWLGLAKKSKPLAFEVPFLISLDRRKGVEVRALKLRSNLTSIGLDAGFDRPLVMPKIELRINDKVMPLDHRAVENDLVKKQAELLKVLQAYLKGFTETTIVDMLNDQISQKIKKGDGFEEVNDMDPPGKKGVVAAGERFKWGLVPSDLSMNADHIYVGVTGFVEDPLARTSVSLPASAVARQAPTLAGHSPDSYDVAIALNQGLMNRMLQLSFNRGYFDQVDVGQGDSGKPDTIKLVQAPEVRLDGRGGKGHGKLHLRVEQNATTLQSIALKDKIQVEFDVDVTFKNSGHGGLKLVMNQIDLDSVIVDRRFIRFGILEGKVKSSVADKFKKTNAGLRAQEKSLVDNLPVPPTVMGVPIQIQDVETESTGNLVLYLNYGDEIRSLK